MKKGAPCHIRLRRGMLLLLLCPHERTAPPKSVVTTPATAPVVVPIVLRQGHLEHAQSITRNKVAGDLVRRNVTTASSPLAEVSRSRLDDNYPVQKRKPATPWPRPRGTRLVPAFIPQPAWIHQLVNQSPNDEGCRNFAGAWAPLRHWPKAQPIQRTLPPASCRRSLYTPASFAGVDIGK
jgi:hypothetical protein